MTRLTNRQSNNVDVREEDNQQPKKVQNPKDGFGNKKLEGPNRPST